MDDDPGADGPPAETPSQYAAEGAPGAQRAEPSAGAEGQPGADERAELEARIAKLEASLAEVTEQLLRKHADFDNFRKRLARDKEDAVRFANTALVEDLVTAIDGLERAISSSETSRDFDGLHQGVVLIEKQLVEGLEKKWGLSRMHTVGAGFDPAQHQAVTMGEESVGGEQVVLEEYESGYTLHGRVLRPAKVKVSAPRRAAPASESGPASGTEPLDGGDGRSRS